MLATSELAINFWIGVIIALVVIAVYIPVRAIHEWIWRGFD